MDSIFRYEMHVHTSACSRCGRSTGEEFTDRARKLGFSGFVLTNHFYHGNSAIDRGLPWREFVGAYAADYEKTKKYAKRYDIDVFFGVEEGYGNAGAHALIYGLSPETIADAPEFPEMSIADIYNFVHRNSGFLAFAHPYRDLEVLKCEDPYPDMRYADAIEVFNAGNTTERNKMAFEYAANTGVRTIAGSDTHSTASFGQGGLIFTRRLYTPENLVSDLFADKYELIVTDNKDL